VAADNFLFKPKNDLNMKKKIKLNLDQIEVRSFVTALDKEAQEVLQGGADTINVGMCTRISCGIASCTRDILNCF
jgi:hypothetical protein